MLRRTRTRPPGSNSGHDSAVLSRFSPGRYGQKNRNTYNVLWHSVSSPLPQKVRAERAAGMAVIRYISIRNATNKNSSVVGLVRNFPIAVSLTSVLDVSLLLVS